MAKLRKSIEPKDRDLFVKLVVDRYDDDLMDRQDWSELRLQRTAKLRGWTEEKNYPWPGASNQKVPLLMTNSQRTQDTLHNAVMGSRPAIVSAIAANKADADKGKSIDELLDHQLFVEQNGEEKIGLLIKSFVDDGNFVAFIPWIKDKRECIAIKPVPQPQDPVMAEQTYLEFLNQEFPGSFAERKDESKYVVRLLSQTGQPETVKVEFFCDDENNYFAFIEQEKVIFDGPCVIPKPLEDVIFPSRCTNLQPPSPSNPGGADHVILVDYPSWDEIYRLQKQGYYDLLTDDDLKQLEERVDAEAGDRAQNTANDPEQHKIQKDAMAGVYYGNAASISRTFTRLTFFGNEDLDGDGFGEQIIARVILESGKADSRKLCRLRYLQEEFPTRTPMRPFAEASFMPEEDQWHGISQTELLEGEQDLTKVTLDMMIDKHALSNTPWGVYRSASGVRPEVIRMSPGELYPVSNPQNDIVFPQMPQQDQTVAFNILALVQQWAERKSMQGQLQFGGVPQGKASALRTSTNMMSVLQQGDARPERILRRFFIGLTRIYKIMHALNEVFLSPNKQYRVTGVVPQGADPYRTIPSPKDISGDFLFDFKANAFNTSRAFKGQALQELAPMLVNGMTLQMGLVDQEKIYNLLKDITVANGQDENRYIKAPPGANMPKITAQDALGQMAMGIMPNGLPEEGAQVHLQMLQMFASQDPRYQLLLQMDPNFGAIFNTYAQQIMVMAQQEMMMAQQAQQFADALGGGGGSGPAGQVDPSADQMNMGQGQNQVADESLPGAKGSV